MATILTNLARCLGVYPAYDMDSLREYPRIPDAYSFVSGYNAANNGTQIVYTVTALKTLHLMSIVCQFINKAAAGAYGYMAVRDALDVIQYRLAWCELTLTFDDSQFLSYPIPIPIDAGWDIVVYSSANNFLTRGIINGYECS